MNCALFDKSTNFGTEVDQYNYYEQILMWSHRPTASWRPWRPFFKMAAIAHPNVRQSLLLEVLVNVFECFESRHVKYNK